MGAVGGYVFLTLACGGIAALALAWVMLFKTPFSGIFSDDETTLEKYERYERIVGVLAALFAAVMLLGAYKIYAS